MLRRLLLLVAALAGCSAAIPPAVAAPEGAFISYMNDLTTNAWRISHFAIKRDGFRTAWRRDAVRRTPEGETILTLGPAPPEVGKPFYGAQVQRSRRTHYGHYEVEMRAARGEGVISSFYTYTGPFYGDHHDEIDFEFLGRDTTKVWVTRFAAGKRLPGQWVELGFDAADDYQIYAFTWAPDGIVWSVDGRELLRINADETAIPTVPGRIHLDIWAGAEEQANWSGTAPDDMHASAAYRCVSYRPLDVVAPMCSDAEPTATDAAGGLDATAEGDSDR